MRRPSATLVLSVAALVLAVTGTAFAGGYIITSTKQIKPSVRKALKGNRGPRGLAGANGLNGAQGAPGVAGPVGLANIVIAQGYASLCSGTVSCSIGSTSATCPAGTKPFGGGVSTAALNGTFEGSINVGNGYTASADNYGSGYTADLYVFAYCSKDVASITFPDGTVGRLNASKARATVAAKLASHR